MAPFNFSAFARECQDYSDEFLQQEIRRYKRKSRVALVGGAIALGTGPLSIPIALVGGTVGVGAMSNWGTKHDILVQERNYRQRQYEYDSLAVSNPQAKSVFELLDHYPDIRLLELLPGSGRDLIRCRMVPYSFFPSDSGNLRYWEAVSYAWDDGRPECRIICDRQKMFITPNLHTSLLALRFDDRSRLLWADAICINQLNEIEKKAQISMMGGAIYSIANAVIVYLGEESEDSNIGVTFAKDLLAVLHGITDKQQVTQLDFEKLYLPPVNDRRWKALRNLLQRSWFFRRWVIQEYAEARTVTMLCGTREFSGQLLEDLFAESFRLGLHKISAEIKGEPLFVSENHPFKTMIEIRAFVRAHIEVEDALTPMDLDMTVAAILNKTRGARNSILHDAIYSLLEVIPFCLCTPNYTQLVEHVFTEWTTKMGWEDTEPLRLLSLASLPKAILTLPSWVPDWSHAGSRTCLAGGDVDQCYRATGARETPDLQYDLVNRELHVQGGIFDEIKGVGEPPADVNDVDTWLETWLKERMQSFAKLTESTHTRYGTEKLDEVCWKTLTGNRDDELKVAPPSYRRFFREYSRRTSNGTTGRFDERTKSSSRTISIMKSTTTLARGRKLCVTKKGYVGQVGEEARVGDHLCLFMGEDVPFAVRKAGNAWVLLGDAYIHGVMQGEVFSGPDFKLASMTLK